MTHEESYARRNADGTWTYIGPDAEWYYQVRRLLEHIRGSTENPVYRENLRTALDFAEQLTGKRYSENNIDPAINDLVKWIKLMATALPLIDEKGNQL
jgi:hypothetical protein